jgi:hypothetical protein
MEPAQQLGTRAAPAFDRNAPRWLGNSAVVLCAGTALLGAFYFGLASCGGLAWHQQTFRAVAIFLFLAALLLPSALLPSLKSKLAFGFVLPAAFAVLESSVAPFYPGPPQSFAQYGAYFLQAVWYGPCS